MRQPGAIPASPAAAAGLKLGDVILAINGHDGAGSRGPALPRRHRRDRQRRRHLTVLRNGQRSRHRQSRWSRAPETPPREETLLEGDNPLAGATVANLSPALAEELGIDDAWEGVVVVSVGARQRGARASASSRAIIAARSQRRRRSKSVSDVKARSPAARRELAPQHPPRRPDPHHRALLVDSGMRRDSSASSGLFEVPGAAAAGRPAAAAVGSTRSSARITCWRRGPDRPHDRGGAHLPR